MTSESKIKIKTDKRVLLPLVFALGGALQDGKPGLLGV
jgi:hypothetical protein